MSIGLGEMAGLATAVSWAVSCQIHTMAGRKVGAADVMVLRAPLFLAAVILVALAAGADRTTPPSSVFFLSCSALAGLAIADPLFYMACLAIGPRLTVLVQCSLTATLTAVLGYFLLGENIGLLGFAGFCIITFGVVLVLSEGGLHSVGAYTAGLSREQLGRGLLPACGASLAMAVSYLCLKRGVSLDIDPLWAAVIRLCIGGILLWLWAAARGRLASALRLFRTTAGLPRLLLYGCAVSTVGNCLAVFAMSRTESGVVAILIGLQPIAIIPVVALMERKYPTFRAVAGTLIAFAGMTVLFLR